MRHSLAPRREAPPGSPWVADPRLTGFNGFSHFTLPVDAWVGNGRAAGPPGSAAPPRRVANLAIELGSDPKSHGEPFVSCLMVTQNRLRQAEIAIACFRRQTWRSRELVIVDTSEDDNLARSVEALGDRKIRHIHLPGRTDSLGDMRNLSVEAAAGTHICQWDDDDMSHAARLEAQIAVMKATNAPVSVLLREMMWVPRRRLLAITNRRAHENTLLSAKAILPPYPGLARREDAPVLEALVAAETVVYLDQPELYVYVAHGANTWDDGHMEWIWRESTRRLEGASYQAAIRDLGRAYPFGDYTTAIAAPARLAG